MLLRLMQNTLLLELVVLLKCITRILATKFRHTFYIAFRIKLASRRQVCTNTFTIYNLSPRRSYTPAT